MKVALFATLLAFGGSLAGFGVVTGTAGGPEVRVTASPPGSSEQVIVSPAADDAARGRNCPKPDAEAA